MTSYDLNAGSQLLFLTAEVVVALAGMHYLRLWRRERGITWGRVLEHPDLRLVLGLTFEVSGQVIGVGGYILVWPFLSAGRQDIAIPLVTFGIVTSHICTAMTVTAAVLILWPVLVRRFGSRRATILGVLGYSLIIILIGAALSASIAYLVR